MRKSLFALAAIVAISASCTKTEIVNTQSTKAIGFDTYAMATKAYTSGDVDNAGATGFTNITAGSFGVVGYKADNSIYLGSTSKAAEQVYNSTSSTWEYGTASELRFWPAGKMDFYAYFPYGASAASFASSNASGSVMTISSWTDGQDVLYAVSEGTDYAARVGLTFKHAFAKIKEVNVVTDGDVKSSGITISVKSVNFLNTNTTGSVVVAKGGTVSYTNATTPVTRKVTPASAVSVSSTSSALIANSSNAYIFPASSLWDGVKANITSGKTLATDSKVVMVLEAKIKQGDVYLIGSDSDYGMVYIPVAVTENSTTTPTAFEAGKRYIYNITMKDNVGFYENGDPILKPIKFSVSSVENWSDVTVNINL